MFKRSQCRRRRLVRCAVGLSITALFGLSGPPAGASSNKPKLLSLSDMPPGWVISSQSLSPTDCLAPLLFGAQTAVFSKGTVPAVVKQIRAAATPKSAYRSSLTLLYRCHSSDSDGIKQTIDPMSYIKVGSKTAAFSIRTAAGGAADMVLFQKGNVVGTFTEVNLRQVNSAQFRSLLKKAVAKA